MNSARVIGNNIGLSIKRHGIDYVEGARLLGMSETDLLRVLSGRLMLTGKELKTLAGTLNVDINDILSEKDNNEYNELIHCMGKIKEYENVDRILDYIDTYITLVEDSNN